jgi:hypothetical protein
MISNQMYEIRVRILESAIRNPQSNSPLPSCLFSPLGLFASLGPLPKHFFKYLPLDFNLRGNDNAFAIRRKSSSNKKTAFSDGMKSNSEAPVNGPGTIVREN